MDVRLIDKSRNVAIEPRTGIAALRGVQTDPSAAMEGLLVCNPPQNGQSEFVVDAEFWTALAAKTPNASGLLVPADSPAFEGHVGTFRGVPVVVR